MRIWTVSEAKAGTLTQCLGPSRYIDPEPHRVIVQRKLKSWRRGLLSPYRRLESPEPDIVVSCGSMAPPHVFSIAAACRKRPLTIHLQTPSENFADRYDMVFISRHDWTEAKARHRNYHQMLGVPHQFTRKGLELARPAARARWLPQRARALAVFIGGPNGAYLFDEPTVRALMDALVAIAAAGWTLMVTTSRRSDPALLVQLLRLRNESILVWDQTGVNPYGDYMAAADAYLITKDTITMACEAVTSGRPVYIFDLAKAPADSADPKLDTFEWFHRDMSETLGLTRPFEGTIGTYTYDPPNEAERIAGLIRAAAGGKSR